MMGWEEHGEQGCAYNADTEQLCREEHRGITVVSNLHTVWRY